VSRDARERILSRVREANSEREPVPHPGPLPETAEPPGPFSETGGVEADGGVGAPGGDGGAGGSGEADPVAAFESRFRAAGGEVVRLADEAEAHSWLEGFAREFGNASICEGVPANLQPALPSVPPSEASLGVSVAVGAAAQTGSLLLSSREGRRSQLLPPVHLVWVLAQDVRTTLGEALQDCRKDLPAVLALHSGPSKSADIGQILVTGVHGPGRIIAVILGTSAAGSG
jgi:L-lactate dehydrogenase complex protein LldG